MELQEAAARASRPLRGDQAWEETHDDIFTDEFLLTRPLLTAIRREEPTVLLVDEVDKTDVEVEGLLLEVLSDFQVTIPELGTVGAVRRPFVVLTSNATRELSEAVKRRCLFLHLDYPDAEREQAIVLAQVPGLEDRLARPDRRDGRAGCASSSCRRRRRSPSRSTGRARWSRWRSATSTRPPSTRRSASCSSTRPTSERAIRELGLAA